MPPKVKATTKPAKKVSSKLFKDEIATGLIARNDREVVKRTFTSKKKEYTQGQIYKEIEKMKTKYAGKNIKFMVSVYIEEIGNFRSSKSFSIKDKAIIIPNTYAYDTTPSFIIYIWEA